MYKTTEFISCQNFCGHSKWAFIFSLHTCDEELTEPEEKEQGEFTDTIFK